ncbi:pectate lyase [Pedobacter sp. MC2016-14]|uniref:pectate lyase family protein n=1 Tax=Pedobacter sp. MC2016-14 TaxID=2897327 RepID=UPI001E5D3F9F|nr:pectate lyase [Pedobacter sp. MC2016-14]MCD0489801.1 pectate lyase [Pedobacter sp. MC2016-14]
MKLSFWGLYVLFLLNLSAFKANGQSIEKPVAFSGAEGFGKYATGGRGGETVAVTNLNDNGEGSFRAALLKYPSSPLTVIFKVEGTIELKSNIKISRPNLTIDGQTAPGNGICLKNKSLIINGASGGRLGNHGNIIIRYLRSRPGGTLSSGLYGIDLENTHDVMIDHCSFSWANEECAAMYDVKNITMQWCIISEGLYQAGHAKGKRSYGGVWGGQKASYHHNLIANQNSRTVRFNGARAHDTLAVVDYRNNVIFNWGSANACYGGEVEINGGRSEVNIVNNYYIPGPATAKEWKFVKANYTEKKAKGVGHWYLEGNVMKGDAALSRKNIKGLDLTEIPDGLRDSVVFTKPFVIEAAYALKDQSAEEALKLVMLNVGAILPKRDAVDERIIDYLKGKGKFGLGSFAKPGIIDSPEAVGGWPF